MDIESKVRTIEVFPYNPEWKQEYIRESEKIRQVFRDELISIYHIGSTSIPGIYAKPVIDILVDVADINKVDGYNKDMEKLGYISKGENGIPGRRYFLKGLYNRTHHVHIFQTGNPEIKRHLNFRDYMISNPEDAMSYGELKRSLAQKFKYDINGYINGKDLFIKEMDIRAKKWAENNIGK